MEVVASRASLSELIVNAIEALMPELPGLFGARWSSDVEYKVRCMLRRAVAQLETSRRYRTKEWREAEVELLYALFDLFSLSPAAENRLAEALETFRRPIRHSNSIGAQNYAASLPPQAIA